METLFADFGIPFPLFEAPIDEASEYRGVSQCITCGQSKQHCFELGIGTAIITVCPQCGTQNSLDASDREDGLCRSCGSAIEFPEYPEDMLCICYECLRSGKAALTKDTEFGMVSWEQAFEGVTHGVPGLDQADIELVPQGDGWVGVRLPEEHLFELLRTPSYVTWQGECWLFCCKEPMIYLGSWGQDEFKNHAPDGNGKALFDEIVEDGNLALWEGKLHDAASIYVFRCHKCNRLRAQWDMA
jgi:uncharacterized protein CbrC (UPF0167 family)